MKPHHSINLPQGSFKNRFQRGKKLAAFTLVEVMVSMVILLSMMLIITEVIGQAQISWKRAASRLSQFREARQAFETITHGLRQADLQSYFSFLYNGNNLVPATPLDPPISYTRVAEMSMWSGNASAVFSGLGNSSDMSGDGILFQGPFGITNDPLLRPLKNLLCARGYFVKFGSDSDYLPSGLASRLQPKYRYRLFELRQATENNRLYNGNPATGTPSGWMTDLGSGEPVQPIAENIIGVLFAPIFGSGTTSPSSLSGNIPTSQLAFNFNSELAGANAKHLPKAIRVVVLAIDEESAVKLADRNGSANPDLLGKSGVNFTSADSLEKDLVSFRDAMTRSKINFRIFTGTVAIPGGDI